MTCFDTYTYPFLFSLFQQERDSPHAPVGLSDLDQQRTTIVEHPRDVVVSPTPATADAAEGLLDLDQQRTTIVEHLPTVLVSPTPATVENEENKLDSGNHLYQQQDRRALAWGILSTWASFFFGLSLSVANSSIPIVLAFGDWVLRHINPILLILFLLTKLLYALGSALVRHGLSIGCTLARMALTRFQRLGLSGITQHFTLFFRTRFQGREAQENTTDGGALSYSVFVDTYDKDRNEPALAAFRETWQYQYMLELMRNEKTNVTLTLTPEEMTNGMNSCRQMAVDQKTQEEEEEELEQWSDANSKYEDEEEEEPWSEANSQDDDEEN